MVRTDRLSPSTPVMESLEPRILLALYTDAQLFLYLLNRCRHDPAAFQQEYGQYMTIDISNYTPQMPLAVNADLSFAAEWKANDMETDGYFSHKTADTPPWPDMWANELAWDAGYNLTGRFPWGQNDIESLWGGANATDAGRVLAAMISDTDSPLQGFLFPEDRNRLLGLTTASIDFREIGVAHAYDPGSALQNYWTVYTAYQDTQRLFLTGMVFNDLNNNHRYDLGEGLQGATVSIAGASTRTNYEGGWSLPVASGSRTVTVSGGGFQGTATADVPVNNRNIEVDFISGRADGVVAFGGASLTVPEAPTGVNASNGTFTDKVRLSWYAQGNITSFEVWRSTTNDIQTANLVASPTDPWCDDTSVVPGVTYYYWIRAVNFNGASNPSAPDIGFANSPPTIGTFTASPNVLMRGDTLTLTAENVVDADGTVAKVQFYRDGNKNGTLETSDPAIGLGTLAGGVWTWTGPTSRDKGWTFGNIAVFARACDKQGGWSAASIATITVNNPDPVPPEAALPSATVTESPGAKLLFDVAYTDNWGLDASDIDAKDIRVTGPNGYNKLASLVRVSSKVDGTPIVATYSIPGPGGTWDVADNGDYTVAMQAGQVRDVNENFVPAGTLGTLTLNLPNAADLTGSFGVIKAPTPLVPGDKFTVPFIIRNVGGIPAKAIIWNTLVFKSAGLEVPLGTLKATISLNPGASTTVNFKVIVPPADADQYSFVATIDTPPAITDAVRANNVITSPTAYDVVWQFGTVALRKNVKMALPDPDGTLLTFAMAGSGTGSLAAVGNAYNLVLIGTTSASSVTVTAVKSKTPGDDGAVTLAGITVGNPANTEDRTSLRSLAAKTANLAGDFTITGGLGTLALNDVSGGRTVTIGPAVKTTDAAALTFDQVSDLVITSAMPIKSLTVTEWVAGTGVNKVTAPSLATLSVKGDVKRLLRGDFQADLDLTSAAAKQSLGTATVAGRMEAVDVLARSAIGRVTVGAFTNCRLFAGVRDGVTGLPNPAHDFAALTSIQSLTVKGLKEVAIGTENSIVAAAKLGTISLGRVTYDNGSHTFGLAGTALTKVSVIEGGKTKSWPQTGQPTPPRMGDFEVDVDKKLFDDGTQALWGRSFPGDVQEPLVPVSFNGKPAGYFRLLELYDQVPSTTSYPLTWTDIVANTYQRSTYQKADGTTGTLGTSVVGTASYWTAAGLQFIPTVTGVAVTKAKGQPLQIATSAAFGTDAAVTTTSTFVEAALGRTVTDVSVKFEAKANLDFSDFITGTNSFRFLTVSSMFASSTQYDANAILYEDGDGQIHSVLLTDATVRDTLVLPAANEMGTWLELHKEPGSTWNADSPTVRVEITGSTGVAGSLGVEAYLADSADPNDDSLTAWVEWQDVPQALAAGTVVTVNFRITATPPAATLG